MTPYYYIMRVGGTAPTFKHATLQAAHTEAQRLAAKHPGESFEILQFLATTRVAASTTFWADGVSPPSRQAPTAPERISSGWRFVLRDRLPTVQEAAESVEGPLCESYWWFAGLNFNRPVMCSVSISCHVKHGSSVRVHFAEETPVGGFGAAHFAGRSFRMWGPVQRPAELSELNAQEQTTAR
jgi:hypothetical protein